MSTAIHEAAIDNFIAVTGATVERATFYLQSAGWNLQSALGVFYEEEQLPAPKEASEERPSILPTAQADSSISASGQDVSPSKARAGFATLSDYHVDQQAEGDDDDSEKFFAGGSEHSGQLIAGPPRKKPNAQKLAKDVFDAAKKQGAVAVEDEEREQQKQRSAAFGGSGFRLGDSEGPSQAVGQRPVAKGPEKVNHVLTFYSNGFAVDDGPLRTGDSEEDRRFLASVSKGEIPQELIRSAKGGEVDINIEDKRNEPYIQRKPRMVVFSGEGRKLGSLTPEVVSHPSQPATTGASASPQTQSSLPLVPLDPSQPTTTVQIRLTDGTRLVSKFNHAHTINDLRQFVNLSRPSTSAANYVLMTTFPNRELMDLTQTLADAKLLNAVIVQRMK